MSASFDYYQQTYYGEILTAEDFPRYIKRADSYLDYITAGKVSDYLGDDTTGLDAAILDKVRMAAAESASGGAIASETVGSHSVSYRSGFETAQAAESELYNIANRYLAWTGLLYRGIPCTRHT